MAERRKEDHQKVVFRQTTATQRALDQARGDAERARLARFRMTIQEQKAADKNLARLPLDGARYLRDVQAADPMLCALIAHHTGAVGEAEERGLATDLAEFGVPAQLGWRLSVLTAADMTTGPDGVAVSPTRIGQILLRYSQGTTSSIGQ